MITSVAKIKAAQAYLDGCEPDLTEYDEFAGELEYYTDTRVIAAYLAGVQWAMKQMQSESLQQERGDQ